MAKRSQRSERRGHERTIETGGKGPTPMVGGMPKAKAKLRQPITTLVNRGGRLMPELAPSHEPGVYSRFYGTTQVTTAKRPKK